jgi:hypothetical protein
MISIFSICKEDKSIDEMENDIYLECAYAILMNDYLSNSFFKSLFINYNIIFLCF